MLLEASNISKSFGENRLFSSGSFRVEPGDRIGLIGANGCGKTTLFKMITGEEEPDSGGIVRTGGVTVGVLAQHACAGSRKTCYDEALGVFEPLIRLEEELDSLHDLLESRGDADLIDKAQLLRERYEREGGLTYKARTRSALAGLGFTEEEMALTVDKLSGGQRSKVEICKLLLSSPDVMLLDEPTNHLDIDAIEWLDGFVRTCKSAVIIISHDRYFLDRVAGKILAIEHGKITCYPGNYTKYLELKELREETVRREYENTMKEVHRIEGIIEQQKRWNKERNIRTAESKQKQIDRLLDGLQIPESERENMTLRFHAEGMCGKEVLQARNLSCSFENKTLYRDVTFSMSKGDRLFIIGKNGCGKTTLIKSIQEGAASFGSGVTVGYFDQHGRTLDPNKTIFTQLRDRFPTKTDTHLRTALALFLFKGEDVFRVISSLSGGERARVALCELMLAGDNFLLLDEPTNHLDLASREILENALDEYEGTILAVSHDRYFINRIASGILYFENEGLRRLDGNYDAYLQLKNSATEEKTEKKPVGSGGAAYKRKKEEQARLRKLKTGVDRAEQEIARLEARQSELHEMLSDPETASDYEKTVTISAELTKIEEELLAAMEQWEALSRELEKSLEPAGRIQYTEQQKE